MKEQIISSEYETMIFTFRGKKVMVDADLAMLYDVPTKALKQQVKRNISRFPVDFMFDLSENEKNELVTNCDRLSFLKHSSVNPMVFTEQGVSMLSSVLRSEKAILINIEIMRAFARYRALISDSKRMSCNFLLLNRPHVNLVVSNTVPCGQTCLPSKLPMQQVSFTHITLFIQKNILFLFSLILFNCSTLQIFTI